MFLSNLLYSEVLILGLFLHGRFKTGLLDLFEVLDGGLGLFAVETDQVPELQQIVVHLILQELPLQV